MRTLVSRPAVARGLPDGALVLGGLVALALTALPVDRRSVPDPEAAVFRVLDGVGGAAPGLAVAGVVRPVPGRVPR